jgi:nicotinamidase-related amidase
MNLVVCCGLQKSYFHPEGSRYLGEKAQILDVRLKYYFRTLNLNESIVYILREVHEPDDTFFINKKSGSLVGSDDIEIPEFYKSYCKFVYNIIRYNAFYKTPLDSEVYKLKPEKVYIIGVETHTTILFTAEEFRNRGYNVTVIEPLVVSSDEYLHAMGITILKNILTVNIQQGS